MRTWLLDSRPCSSLTVALFLAVGICLFHLLLCGVASGWWLVRLSVVHRLNKKPRASDRDRGMGNAYPHGRSPPGRMIARGVVLAASAGWGFKRTRRAGCLWLFYCGARRARQRLLYRRVRNSVKCLD